MKLKMSLMLLAFICGSQTHASQFFSLKYEKKGRDYTNQLTELKQEDGAIIQQVTLSPTWKFSMERLKLPVNKHLILYGTIDNKKALLQIVDKTDISQIKNIEMAHIHNRLVAQNQFYTFYHLTEDHKHLLIHTGTKKNQKLLVIDVAAGTVLKEIPLSKFKNEVSLSSDKNYILINNTSKDELTVLRLADFNVALTSKLGEYRQYGTIHHDHLYLTKYSGTKQKKQYWIQAIDLKSKNKVNIEGKSKAQPVFASSETSNKLYSINTDEKGKRVFLSELKGTESSTLHAYDIKNLSPDDMYVIDDFDQILVKQRNRIATFDLGQSERHAVTKLPFDTASYFYNTSGNLLYLREGTGSEVAVVDVPTGELIERSGTGRPGVKFGQFMATVALAGVTGGATGYMYIGFKYSSTGMILNRTENKLYVINWKTNDVTQFNAGDLSGRKAIATGRGTFLIYQGDEKTAPVWVFSNKQITQINDQTFAMTQAIEYEDIVGFDEDQDYFIIKTEEQIQTYDMKTGQITNQWPMLDAQLIWSE